MAAFERSIKFTSESGFPTKVYMSLVGWLAKKGYDVHKMKDWLEVNPKTAYHQDVMQRRQALEQSLGRVMSVISEMRKDIEMIKHDVRKFEQVERHCKEGKEEVLKADFMDVIDDPSKPGSLLQLQNKGRFPSIVIDFMRVNSKDDIKKLKVSKSEKNILEIKLQLYNEWKSEYCKAIEPRVKVLREELNSRLASLENYKQSIQPYLQALNKIKISEGHYKGLTDPLIIEGYSTSIAGVDLVAWRGMEAQEKYKLPEEQFTHYIYFEVKIKRENITVKGQEIEEMEIKITSGLKDRGFIEAKKKEIKKLEENLYNELKSFKGGPLPEEPKKKEELTGLRKTIESLSKASQKHWNRATGKTGPYHLPKGYDKPLKEAVYDESIDFYDAIKEMIGGMKFKHPRL